MLLNIHLVQRFNKGTARINIFKSAYRSHGLCCMLSCYMFSNTYSDFTEIVDFFDLLFSLKIYYDSQTASSSCIFIPSWCDFIISYERFRYPRVNLIWNKPYSWQNYFCKGIKQSNIQFSQAARHLEMSATLSKGALWSKKKNKSMKCSVDKLCEVAVILFPAIIRWSIQISLD